MKRFFYLITSICLLLLIASCGHPTISSDKVSRKKTLTVVQTPDFRNLAVIGAGVSPYGSYHFSSRSDFIFNDAIEAPSPQNSVTAGIIVGAIESSAAETQNRAKRFDSLVRQEFPKLRLQESFMDALDRALETRQRRVRHFPERSTVLVWPARDESGEPYRSGTLLSTPPVDSDLLVQVSPIAIWTAINGLHPYAMNVSVGIAIYDGRTKEFLGRQTINLENTGKYATYTTYGQLVDNLKSATPALQAALLSLVPKAADVIAGVPSK